MSEFVQSAQAQGVLTLTLNRPDKKNALTQAMYRALSDALQQAADDPAVRVVVLGGAGDCFTAGNDLAEFRDVAPGGGVRAVNTFLTAVSSFPKPLVAAVHGLAIGIGTTLLLHCDFVVAAHGTRLQLPFVNLGLCPEAASSYLLPRRVGWPLAARWLMLGEPFSAEDAHAAGLVGALAPGDQVHAQAQTIAAALAAKPAASVRLTKALMRRADADVISTTITEEVRHFGERLASAEAAEAFAAFFEKRKPDFSRFD